jgi:hypothetical protein
VGNTATGLKKEVFLDVFAKAPLLESLRLYASIDSAAFLLSARDRIAAARDGGTSLLRRLSIGADGSAIIDWESGMSAGAVGALGAAFPELEELNLTSLHPFGEGGMPHHAMHMDQDDYFDIGGGDEDELGELWAKPWQPMPRLSTVEISGIGCPYRKAMVHDAFVSSLLTRLAVAAPGLRKLNFSRGHEQCARGRCSGSAPNLRWRRMLRASTIQYSLSNADTVTHTIASIAPPSASSPLSSPLRSPLLPTLGLAARALGASSRAGGATSAYQSRLRGCRPSSPS